MLTSPAGANYSLVACDSTLSILHVKNRQIHVNYILSILSCQQHDRYTQIYSPSKALGDLRGQARVRTWQREGQEKQLFELMRAMRQPSPHEGTRRPSCITDRSHQDLSLRHEGCLVPPWAIFAWLAPPQFCSLLVVPRSRTWQTTRNHLQSQHSQRFRPKTR